MITKGHLSFVEFLDKVLPPMGLNHQYTGTTGYRDYVYGHQIDSVKVVECSFLFFHWKEEVKETVARIIAEPYSIVEDGESGSFKVEVLDKEFLPLFKALMNEFIKEFDLETEIRY